MGSIFLTAEITETAEKNKSNSLPEERQDGVRSLCVLSRGTSRK